MEVDYVLVSFEDLKVPARYAEKIRGYFGNKYTDNILMHNHSEDKFHYSYPVVQYKVISKTPYICAIKEGTSHITNLFVKDDILEIDNQIIDIYQKKLIKDKINFGITNDYIEYEFITPWIALNQANVKIYEQSNKINKDELLKKIIIGNIISMSKGIGYSVDEQIHVWLNLTEVNVKFKNISMIAFKGNFKVNFCLPDYFGIGKSVSRGFGTIIKTNH